MHRGCRARGSHSQLHDRPRLVIPRSQPLHELHRRDDMHPPCLQLAWNPSGLQRIDSPVTSLFFIEIVGSLHKEAR